MKRLLAIDYIVFYYCILSFTIGAVVASVITADRSIPAPYYVICGVTDKGSWIMVHPDCCIDGFTILEGCKVVLGTDLIP